MGYYGKMKSWIGQGGSLNHLPFFLEIEIEYWKTPTPFKFNHTRLIQHDFRGIVSCA
jgi:hypothetical protein